MRFFDLNKKTPKNMQRCVIKEKYGKHIDIFGSSCLQIWWDDSRFMGHPNVIAWAPVPEHITVNPKGWRSEYRGDDLPAQNCRCLVCTESSKSVRYAYFHEGRFLAHPDVIAFMEI